jgi:hypothetical protein
MARVVSRIEDESVTHWLRALIDLSREERGCTLGQFCEGICTYRLLYQVVDGKSAISTENLAALKLTAKALRIDGLIESKVLAKNLGLHS